MNFIIQAISPRSFRSRTQVAGLLVCLALTACNLVDPLDAIREQQAAGEYEATIEPLRDLQSKRPDDPEVNFLYGRALAFTNPSIATWSLRKAMEDPEWLAPAGMQLAFLALSGGDFGEVIKIVGRILEREPENVRALLVRANAYAHSKQHPELALADAERVLELDPLMTEAYESRILALLSLERLEEATQALEEAGRMLVELETKESVLAWHCSTTAAFQEQAGDLEQARETWTACVDAHPTDWEVVSNAIVFYDAQGEPQRSLSILRTALEGDPNSRVILMTLVQRLVDSGGGAEAEGLLLEPTRSENPQRAASAWSDLAKFYQALEKYGSAADASERGLELVRQGGPPSPQLLFEHADALLLADRLDQALEIAEELTVPAHRHLIIGRVSQERRDPARALEEFDQALQLWPDNPWARYYAALAAEEFGDFARALDEYRNAVRIDPAATDGRTRGASLLLAKDEPQAALMLIQTEVAIAPLEIEGLLVGLRVSGQLGDPNLVAEFLKFVQSSFPGWEGVALAEAAEGLAEIDPAKAVSMIATAPGIDFNDPLFFPTLRAFVKYSHEVGETAEMQAVLRKVGANHSESATVREILALDLELSGAPAEAVHAEFTRALELDARNARALAGLGRLALDNDPEAALGFFDRAISANPFDADLKLQAARILMAAGKENRAAERLDLLLLEHPYESEAAAERARLDLERGTLTPATLERARRAVYFSGGADALELLSRVNEQRGEPELAAKAARKAQGLREPQAPADPL